ncbi:MAG TPA: type II toxin-antitoxin system VapC family toxin [Acidobacteriota bacterium]|jgi:PIN domain nuclease of toxin-antitoxin system|nr:type II toxin-antitoxin system VapC family toxin [Acidobacteriota bacterium]
MKLLLDTHVWLWSLLDPQRLSVLAAKALGNPSNQLWLSPLSSWEAAMLAARGRIHLLPDPVSWLRQALQRVPMETAALTHEVAWRSAYLEKFHVSDPVDRFLAASCLTYNLTLVTADRGLHSYPQIETIW